MCLPERRPALDQPHLSAHHVRNRIRQLAVELLQHVVNHPPEPSRRQLALARRLINRDDAPGLQRLPFALFFAACGAVFDGIVQDLKLRLHDLQPGLAARRCLHFAVQGYDLPGAKLISQIGRVEQDAL